MSEDWAWVVSFGCYVACVCAVALNVRDSVSFEICLVILTFSFFVTWGIFLWFDNRL